MNTITELNPHVRRYAKARSILSERVALCQEEQQAIYRRKKPGIDNAAAEARDAKAALEAAIEQNPQLFKKPKTQTIEGIKLGYRKGKGKLTISKNAVELIKKHYPELAEQLIKIEEKPVKEAIANLPSGQLRKIGCTVTDASDQIVITTPKDDLDKVVDAILQDKS